MVKHNDMIQSHSYLIFDIETAPAYAKLEDAPEAYKKAWEAYCGKHYTEMGVDAAYTNNAALHPEFGRVVSISAGYFVSEGVLKMKNLCGDDEKGLLEGMRSAFASTKPLAGHYIMDFDIPFLAKRMIKHGVTLPNNLFLVGVKPWEVRHLDTYNWWKLGSYRQSCGLDQLCMHLGIPSPKSDIDGSQVGGLFYQGQYERIKVYNNEDVLAVARVMYFLEGRNWESIKVEE